MKRSENRKWVGLGVLVLACVLLVIHDAAEAEATQVLTLRKHAGKRSGGWHDDDEWRRSLGIVCKCCDGATCTPASASAPATACSNLRCLPWKFH